MSQNSGTSKLAASYKNYLKPTSWGLGYSSKCIPRHIHAAKYHGWVFQLQAGNGHNPCSSVAQVHFMSLSCSSLSSPRRLHKHPNPASWTHLPVWSQTLGAQIGKLGQNDCLMGDKLSTSWGADVRFEQTSPMSTSGVAGTTVIVVLYFALDTSLQTC